MNPAAESSQPELRTPAPAKRGQELQTKLKDGRPNGPSGQGRTMLNIAAVLARWVLGLLFIYMGLSKALHPEQFLKLVREYEMVSSPFLLNSIAAALPWFEVCCGLLLLAGVAVRGAALMLVCLLVPFTIVIFLRALAIAGAKGLAFCAVKFNCGCGTGEVFICPKLVENGLLLLLALWLVIGRGRQLCARFSLFRVSASPTPVSALPGTDGCRE